ncbi:hypothetical protein F2Q69_00018417 [Brassica cretica]|uniref:Uncharacterized protein n=1 Tax=Brassica cretica TaxID=69181 RepID=A0A8S9QIL1_BRACR|nr:hypothetical protein F2Q69_00018417 [Brassica cretica]
MGTGFLYLSSDSLARFEGFGSFGEIFSPPAQLAALPSKSNITVWLLQPEQCWARDASPFFTFGSK